VESLLQNLKSSKDKKIALLGIPFDDNSSYMRGPADAPPLIRQALRCDSSNLWTENGTDLEHAPWLDAGDLDFATTMDAFGGIQKGISTILEHGLNPISLGGDHSITYPILKALYSSGLRFGILHFDAHPDLYDELQGNRYSHACPFARILEEGLATRLVQIGIRTANAHQRDQAKRFGVEMMEMRNLQEQMTPRFNCPIYVSIDLDVLDPAYAPGVSHHEPGGMTTRQLITAIQSIRDPIIGADIVEFNPKRDPLGITAMTAAKILKELLAKMLDNPE
jgi:agmatinase